jgi:polyisoprenoid-binding protein YceI
MRPGLMPALLLTAACTACAQTPPPPPPAPVAAPVAAAAPTPPAPPPPMPKFVPPSHNPAAVASGTYSIEPYHTQVMFSVLHLGTSTFYGTFSQASGTLTIDAKNPALDTLDVSVPIDSVYTTSAKLVEELKSKAWFDAADYPTMSFKSTKVIPTGKTTAKVLGELTLHGVTKPVTLSAQFVAVGKNPLMGNVNVGFSVTGTIKRSDFGITAAVPLVSDETKIIISAVFKQ